MVKTYRVGVNLYGLGEDLTEAFQKTIRSLHQIGFNGIEAPFLNKEKQGKWPGNLLSKERMDALFELTKRYGMEMPSIHIAGGFGHFLRSDKAIAKDIDYLNGEYGVKNFVLSGPFSTAKDAAKWGSKLKNISKMVAPLSCHVIYHNHDAEFTKLSMNGQEKYALDVFFDAAGDSVLLQLDIGWARFADDEIAIVKRYKDRIASLHFKDFYGEALSGKYKRTELPGELFAPVGSGVVRMKEIFQLTDDMPHFNDCLIIDQDKCGKSDSMLKNLEQGYHYLKAICEDKETIQ